MVYRFYFKCPRCSAELVMKTDPKNSDYVVEAGASRNYEPWKDADAQVEAALKAREEEETGDAMKALENRTAASKREMDINNALDELRSMSNRHAGVAIDDVLAAVRRKEEEEAQMFDAHVEAATRAAFQRARGGGSGPAGAGAGLVRRIEDDDEDEEDGDAGGKRPRTEAVAAARGGQQAQLTAAAPPPKPSRPQVTFAVKRKDAPPTTAGEAAPGGAAAEAEKPAGGGALAGLAMYGSSDDE